MKGESKEKKIRKVRVLEEREKKEGRGRVHRKGLEMYLKRQVLPL